MSEPDKKSDSGVEGSAVVLVEQPAASRHKQPFRSSEFQEETADLHHKRSKAPSVPLSSERLHTSAAKKLSHVKKRDSSPETITLAAMDAEPKVGTRSPSQPIPAQLSETSIISDASDKIGSGKKDDDDITEEIAELRSPESTSRTNWQRDDEESSGLPRLESRASRASRAVRQMLCCGLRIDTPSEHQISPREDGI